jgi:hypothetical protein
MSSQAHWAQAFFLKFKPYEHAHVGQFIYIRVKHAYYVWISDTSFKHQLEHTYWQNYI